MTGADLKDPAASSHQAASPPSTVMYKGYKGPGVARGRVLTSGPHGVDGGPQTRAHTHAHTRAHKAPAADKEPPTEAWPRADGWGTGPLTALPCLRGRTGQKREPAIGSGAQNEKAREDVR